MREMTANTTRLAMNVRLEKTLMERMKRDAKQRGMSI
jgi:hypothetical protein